MSDKSDPEAVETLLKISDNVDYYEAVKAKIHVETTGIDFDFRLSETTVDLRDRTNGCRIVKGQDRILINASGDDARLRRPGGSNHIKNVEIELPGDGR